MLRRLALLTMIGLAASACAKKTELDMPFMKSMQDLPAGQYYDQGLPAPHHVHERPYTTVVTEPDEADLPVEVVPAKRRRK